MANIIVLDETIANQIAAGEVVERPVSVVKELVENSLDAGAQRISVELTQGGITGIKVVDNGCGMSAQDAALCFQRHATSKIRRPEDLNRINTLGFRGEALPSIAAVARVTLTTRTAGELGGTAVRIEAGQIKEIAAVGCPVGTTVEVTDLFFNTPARRKFLKSVAAETGQISDLLAKLALARPDVRFELRSGNRILFVSPGSGSLKDAAAVILGAANLNSMLEVNCQGELLAVKGLISKPVLTRASRQYQNFFINGRYIRSSLFSNVLQQAYENQIPGGRFPVAVLHLTIDPAQVDVNVHPTKMEVRLAREKEVLDELTAALIKPLQSTGAIGGLWENMPARRHERQATPSLAGSVYSEQRAAGEPAPPAAANRQTEQQHVAAEKSGGAINSRQLHFALPLKSNPSMPPVEQTERITEKQQDRADSSENILLEQQKDYRPAVFFPALTPTGLLPPTYVLAYGEGGLYIIDQHAAHERVLYEKYLQQLQQEVVAQMLLTPVPLEIPPHEAQLTVRHILDFNKLGFIVEHFGGDTFLLRGIPPQAAQAPGEIFMDLLALLQESPSRQIDMSLVIDRLAASMACREAVKAGKNLGSLEIKALLSGLAGCRQPFTCPHGRPTLIQISHEELNKRFKR
ncbi:DNA mismatch repair endonuclease MutL [Desulforamulus hydrothermalis]|uniref:DNA mismatch repair endonuclease MutL n=1 Tax=Desulforamulus hydrothermalis TaxID=412895 RepID=UPI0006625A25|nr:DNA mismatch repair endonuclease MutL [Desulforamulus hydrothermalis]